jgi:hydroxymethylglutaryl-CoA reductase (NADPH)
MPFSEAPSFLVASQEIPVSKAASQARFSEDGSKTEEKKWIMKAVRSSGSGSVRRWAKNVWADFLDLLKNAETLDIVIMILGYISMHLTFVSLFLSMRRLGSNAWLGVSVLFSSVFAFLFALIVTTKLGVPLNMVLLSEGLPFLVVTIGFEKPIILTKAVLAHALDRRRIDEKKNGKGRSTAPPTIQYAVSTAVKEKGADIVRDYLVEILILICGAASGVQGGLRQFCFLAAWILVFDCILLFTFYTAILTIKLEINRIKRHVAFRKALEDDGVSRKVAENVASSNDWPKQGEPGSPSSEEHPVFAKDSSIPRFKVIMVGGFIVINLLNLCMIPFRKNAGPLVSGLSSVVANPPIDPFKVAGNGLESILEAAKAASHSTIVTVFSPIKYELEYPSVHYAVENDASAGFFEGAYADQIYAGVGGHVLDGVLKSFEDPVLSKWIVVGLVMSLALNGYLFNAARWTIKEPAAPEQPPKDSEVMDQIPAPRPRAVAPPVVIPPTPIQVPQPAAEADPIVQVKRNGESRTMEQMEAILKAKQVSLLDDDELIELAQKGKIPGYALEKTIGDSTRAVKVRRAVVSRTHSTRETAYLLESSKLPYEHFDYDRVLGACCENVIGYMPLPLGVAGPVNIDGQNYFLPMATTEGVLVASTSRGCKAINAGGGASTILTADGMTRGPCVKFPSARRAGEAKVWVDDEEGQKMLKTAFDSTSRFARLQTIKTAIAGNKLFIRFKTKTGDAMGMNMISKGVEHALSVMATEGGFDDMDIISLSGNYCTDKKAAAINWIDGRGKSVVAEATIPAEVVKSVLKTTVEALVELNVSKNLVGSAMAGSIGGFNAHAANLVAAVFIATGQDPAQVVESANCITLMEK